jgi:hypothetical protein
MKITPYNGSEDLEDIESLSIVIKTVPNNGDFVPAFFIQSPGDEYPMSLEELNCLMDGVEIARKALDQIIDFILKSHFDEEDQTKKKKKLKNDE